MVGRGGRSEGSPESPERGNQLERAAGDADFVLRMLHSWADALEEYDLTGPEKLALLTGDIEWIEKQVGPLTDKQKRWLQRPLSAEVLKIFGW